MYVYMCVCEFTRMITNFSLARTERSLSLLLRCFALLCVVLTLALAIAPVFVRLVAQSLPLLSLSMLLVWLVVVLLLLLVLGFLRFLSLQSSFSVLVLLSSCRAVFAMLLQTGAFPMLLLLLWYYCYYYWTFCCSQCWLLGIVALACAVSRLLLSMPAGIADALSHRRCALLSAAMFYNDLCTSFSLLGSKARQTCADQIGHILGIRLGKNMKQAQKETWKKALQNCKERSNKNRK